MAGKQAPVPVERIERAILLIRGQKVMLDADLAELYGVEPRVLIQAVKRNIDRFPQDFMFQLTKREFSDLRSQIVMSSWGGGDTPHRIPPAKEGITPPTLNYPLSSPPSALNSRLSTVDYWVVLSPCPEPVEGSPNGLALSEKLVAARVEG